MEATGEDADDGTVSIASLRRWSLEERQEPPDRMLETFIQASEQVSSYTEARG